MQLQRRIAMRVIEQGLDPKTPCVLDKHGNIRQKPKKQLHIITEVENQSIAHVPEISTVEELTKISTDSEPLEVSEVSIEEITVQTDESTPSVAKSAKSKFTKKK